jgi:hypothetical protein
VKIFALALTGPPDTYHDIYLCQVRSRATLYILPERTHPADQLVDVGGAGGVDFDDGAEGEGFFVFGDAVRGHGSEGVRGVVAFEAGAAGEASRGFFAGQAAVDFDDPGAALREGGDFGSLLRVPGAEICFEHEGRAVGGEGPEEVHGGVADPAGEFEVAGRPVEGGEEGFLDVVFGEEGEAQALGERTSERGFSGSGRTGDEDDAMAGERNHVTLIEQE